MSFHVKQYKGIVASCMVVVTSLCVFGVQIAVAETLSVNPHNEDIAMFISYDYTPYNDSTIITANIHLVTYSVPLNAFEVEINFDKESMELMTIVPHDALCEPRFVIDNFIDNEGGVGYMSCGTITPFVSGAEDMVILSFVLISENSAGGDIRFGERTSFYMHDGLGTRAQVIDLSVPVENAVS